MTDGKKGASGYRLEKVYALEARYERVPTDEDLERERPLEFFWDWRILEPRRFEVVFGAAVSEGDGCPDMFMAVVAGSFELVGDVQSIAVQKFVSLNAPALLTPYLREALSSLSGRGAFSTYYLPPINIGALSEELDFNASTGATQMEEQPQLLGPLAESESHQS